MHPYLAPTLPTMQFHSQSTVQSEFRCVLQVVSPPNIDQEYGKEKKTEMN